MEDPREREQWSMSVVLYHGPSYGHRLELWTQARGREPFVTSLGSWKGLGLPNDVFTNAIATVDACLSQYLSTRYGVQDTLWDTALNRGEVEPF